MTHAAQLHRNSLGYSLGHDNDPMIVWGRDQANKLISIADAERGGSQSLRCECGVKLVAKKGTEMAHHFAHASGQATSCEAATKAAALRFISDTLLDAGLIRLPDTHHIVGRTAILAVTALGHDGIASHLLDCPKDKQLHLVTRIKQKPTDELARNAKAAGMSTMSVDLFRKRSLPDEELREALLETASRAWLFRSTARDLKAPFHMRRRLFGLD